MFKKWVYKCKKNKIPFFHVLNIPLLLLLPPDICSLQLNPSGDGDLFCVNFPVDDLVDMINCFEDSILSLTPSLPLCVMKSTWLHGSSWRCGPAGLTARKSSLLQNLESWCCKFSPSQWRRLLFFTSTTIPPLSLSLARYLSLSHPFLTPPRLPPSCHLVSSASTAMMAVLFARDWGRSACGLLALD